MPHRLSLPRHAALPHNAWLSHHRSIPRYGLLPVLLLGSLALAQTPAPTPPADPHGTVLFERSTPAAANPDTITTEPAPPAAPSLLARPASPPTQPATAAPPPTPDTDARPNVTDADRTTLRFTAYNLDARITPATAALAMRARITVTNAGSTPLARIPLQISSTLRWETATLLGSDGRRTPLALDQHLLETDADHTGQANEAILTLPAPLAPGAAATLDTFYTGTIAASGGRLERIGATPAQAAGADWDTLAATPAFGPAIRGFGNVLWYPVAAPQLFLGDGNRLFAAIAQQRAAGREATIHLRLSVLYSGEPPVAAYFCSRRQPLLALPDDPDTPIASGSGIATADFPVQPVGFRLPSLFVIDTPETLLAPLRALPNATTQPATTQPAETQPAETQAAEAQPAQTQPAGVQGKPLLAVVAPDDRALPLLTESAETIAPLLETWLGAHPVSALTVLDHDGQPFEEGPLLVAPVATLGASTSGAALTHSLTHAWVQTGQPWIDDGLAQFLALVWVEQQQGRAAALAQMADLLKPLALAEPAITADSSIVGQPLPTATDELYYRRKSAAVFVQLRALVGDAALQQALRGWIALPSPTAQELQKLLETAAHKDLAWFFDDWVLRDRGLPDLTVVDVTPRQLPAGKGHDSGWLVAVTVRNDGAAAAEVPLLIRSGTFTVTRQLRVPGLGSVTDRVVTEAEPTQVVVNDGTVPEVRVAVHTVALAPQK